MWMLLRNGWRVKPHLCVLHGAGAFLKRRLLPVSITWGRGLDLKQATRTEGVPWVGQMGYKLWCYPRDQDIWEELSDGGCQDGVFHLETHQMPGLIPMASYSSIAGKCQEVHFLKLALACQIHYSHLQF